VSDHDPDTGPVWFLGDLDDPWVAAIAGTLPAAVERINCPGELPDDLAAGGALPSALVLHRAVLTGRDAAWLARLRGSRTPTPRVVLCHGPHVRYADLQRWADLYDAAVPEGTARDTVARLLTPSAPSRPAPGSRPRVAVVSTNPALREMLAEACALAGYPVAAARDWAEAPATGPAVWDVPVLEPDWPRVLERRARAGPIVALIGFADRGLAAEARARGASACLDLPVDLGDLTAALDRLAAPTGEPAHDLPPPPRGRWSSRESLPRMTSSPSPNP
jgi:CheY-like chemotaxis protein